MTKGGLQRDQLERDQSGGIVRTDQQELSRKTNLPSPEEPITKRIHTRYNELLQTLLHRGVVRLPSVVLRALRIIRLAAHTEEEEAAIVGVTREFTGDSDAKV